MGIAGRLRAIATSVLRDVTREGQRRLRSATRSGGSSNRRGSGGGRSRDDDRPVDAGRAEQRRLDVVTPYDVGAKGLPTLAYTPHDDDRADPGEVVWAWVPYDEMDGRGKDRPVLVLARVDGGVLGVQMTSKDRADGGVFTDRHGNVWIDVGSGSWDHEDRESEARLDRILHLPDSTVRREGGALDRKMFERVTEVLAQRY